MKQTDSIILNLIEYLRFKKQIKNESDFAKRVGMFPATLTKIKNGTAHFTVDQITKICIDFNVNANFIHGIQSNVFNDKNSIEIDIHLSAEQPVK